MVMTSCLVGVVLFEVALRFVNSNDQWSKTNEGNILRNVQFRYDVSQLYATDTSSVKYVRNQYGLRDVCKSPSEIEILTIGGSTTDQRYIPFASTYQAIIEKRLKNFNDSFGCVSNAGVDGHSTWGHLFSFEYWFPLIPYFKPKIILLYVGLNDANFNRTSANSFDINKSGGVKAFLKSFELVKALLPIYRLLRQSKENASAVYARHIPITYNTEDYKISKINKQTEFLSEQNAFAFRSRMQLILEEIRILDAKPLCITQPHRYVKNKDGVTYGIANVLGNGFSGIDYDYSIKKINEVIFDLCGRNTIDLYSYEFSNSHFYDGVHTTPEGSKKIGKIISDFLIKKYY